MNETRGRIEAIWLKRQRRGQMDPVQRAEARADQGIVGNANQGGWRHVTVLSKEAWERAQDALGAEVDPAGRRANVLVTGVDLEECRDRILRLGEVRIRLRGETRPCARMDDAHQGLRDALDPEWRGGAFGVVLDDGAFGVGDRVEWVEDAS